MISCRVWSPFRISPLPPTNALRPIGRLLHHTMCLDETERSLVASKGRWLRYEFYNGLHSYPSRGRRTVCGKSLDHRHHGHAGNLYGVARHGYCECFFAAYRRRSSRQLRREHLGPDELSGIECCRSAAFRMAEPGFWAQTLLHALCRAVYFELAALRTCAFIRLAHFLSRSAGRRRRRVSSGRAGYSCGHLSASEASGSIRPLQHGHRHRPGDWPPLGGWITDSWSWRWIFFINIPIGIVSLILTKRLVSDPPEFTREVEAARK